MRQKLSIRPILDILKFEMNVFSELASIKAFQKNSPDLTFCDMYNCKTLRNEHCWERFGFGSLRRTISKGEMGVLS